MDRYDFIAIGKSGIIKQYYNKVGTSVSYIEAEAEIKKFKDIAEDYHESYVQIERENRKLKELIQKAINWNNGFSEQHPFDEMEKLIEKEGEIRDDNT